MIQLATCLGWFEDMTCSMCEANVANELVAVL